MKSKENSAVRLRFNIIDAFIVILAVACIAVAILRFTIVDEVWANSSGEKYYITFKVDSLSYSQLESIVSLADSSENGNNWVYFADGSAKIGNLTAVEGLNQETISFENPDGTITLAPYDDLEQEKNITWTVKGKILCLGTYNENSGFLLNNTQYISANTEIAVRTALCEFNMTIIDIEKSME